MFEPLNNIAEFSKLSVSIRGLGSFHRTEVVSSLGAGTNNDRLVDDIFTTRLLKNIEQSLKDLEEGNNRNAKSVLKTFLEVMV